MKMFKNSFWGIMKKADWEHEDSQNILEPVITFLANHDDKYIFHIQAVKVKAVAQRLHTACAATVARGVAETPANTNIMQS